MCSLGESQYSLPTSTRSDDRQGAKFCGYKIDKAMQTVISKSE